MASLIWTTCAPTSDPQVMPTLPKLSLFLLNPKVPGRGTAQQTLFSFVTDGTSRLLPSENRGKGQLQQPS